MQNSDIVLMQEAEKKYWWHVGRRLILQSVLRRFLGNVCRHSVFDSDPSAVSSEPNGGRALRLRLERGEADGCRLTPESYNLYDPGRCQDDDAKKSSSVQDDGMQPLLPLPLLRGGWVGCVKAKILDVGCGSGINMQWLKQFGKVTGVDNNQQAIKLAQKYGQAIMADALKLPLPNNSFDLVTAFDVLEHIKDDKLAIKEWNRVLVSNGYLFMAVPAYQWLFGPHDKNLQHYRRYNHSQLSHLLLLSGFKIVVSSYIFMFTFPVFLIQRLIAKTTRESTAYPSIPSLINNFFIMLSKLETWLIRFIRLPFGSSLIILAQKND